MRKRQICARFAISARLAGWAVALPRVQSSNSKHQRPKEASCSSKDGYTGALRTCVAGLHSKGVSRGCLALQGVLQAGYYRFAIEERKPDTHSYLHVC